MYLSTSTIRRGEHPFCHHQAHGHTLTGIYRMFSALFQNADSMQALIMPRALVTGSARMRVCVAVGTQFGR